MMTENERQQRMVERILEDERLRGDLEDTAATALIQWASERAGAAAADPTRSDDAVEADVQAVRKAARAAALSGETDPQRLLAVAESNLAPGTTLKPESAAAAPAAAKPTQPAAQAPQTQNVPATAPDSAWAAAPAAAKPTQPAAQAPQTQIVPAAAPDSAKVAAPAAAKPAQAPQTQNVPAAAASSSRTSRPRRRRRNRLAEFLKRVTGKH
jgi:hypothetical protein